MDKSKVARFLMAHSVYMYVLYNEIICSACRVQITTAHLKTSYSVITQLLCPIGQIMDLARPSERPSCTGV